MTDDGPLEITICDFKIGKVVGRVGTDIVSAAVVELRIMSVRGKKVILDVDLAELCGVELRTLTQAVRRNIGRFPDDFMFSLTPQEWTAIRDGIGHSIRAFVRLRELLQSHEDLARRLAELEARYDSQFAVVFDAIRQLMLPPEPPRKHPLGFRPPVEQES